MVVIRALAGLARVETIALHGTKIKANAWRHGAMLTCP